MYITYYYLTYISIPFKHFFTSCINILLLQINNVICKCTRKANIPLFCESMFGESFQKLNYFKYVFNKQFCICVYARFCSPSNLKSANENRKTLKYDFDNVVMILASISIRLIVLQFGDNYFFLFLKKTITIGTIFV